MSIAAAERAIVNRLIEKCGDMVDRVYTAAEIAQIEENLQTTPNISVVYNGYRLAGDIAGGVIQAVTLSFFVVVAVRSAYFTGRSQGARDEASPIIDAVIESLLNFRALDGAGSVLRLTDAPGANFSETGFAYYPLGFETTRTYRSK